MSRRTRRRRSYRFTALILLIVVVLVAVYWDRLPTGAILAGPTTAFYESGPVGAAKLEITVIDVGQGDAILVTTSDHHAMLVDGGDNAHEDMGRTRVLPAIRDKGVAALDWVIATHPHSDHIGGLISVMGELPVTRFGESGITHTTADYRNLLLAVKRSGASYKQLRAGEVFALGEDTRVRVLWPADGNPGDLNNRSVVLEVICGTFHILLPGDLESEGQRELMAREGPSPCAVVKAPHHGSGGALYDAFWDRLSPRVVLISCGTGNTYGHPHARALSFYERLGARIFRTDQLGNLVVVTDGTQWSVRGTNPRASAGISGIVSELVSKARKAVGR